MVKIRHLARFYDDAAGARLVCEQCSETRYPEDGEFAPGEECKPCEWCLAIHTCEQRRLKDGECECCWILSK